MVSEAVGEVTPLVYERLGATTPAPGSDHCLTLGPRLARLGLHHLIHAPLLHDG